MSGQFHAPVVLPPRKGPTVAIEYEASMVDMETWKLLTLPVIELRPLCRPARSQALYIFLNLSVDKEIYRKIL
jgi:hypothetical protein